MTRYSVQPRDRIFSKVMDFCFSAKNMGKNIGKNIRKNLSRKYSQKQSAKVACKSSSKRTIEKTAEATGDLIGDKITDKIMKVSKTSQQNNSEAVTNEYDKKFLKKDIYLQKKDRKLLMI